jgi:hypothetical protein
LKTRLSKIQTSAAENQANGGQGQANPFFTKHLQGKNYFIFLLSNPSILHNFELIRTKWVLGQSVFVP